LLSQEDVANHMNFFMLAAHDTLTSSLTAFVHRLAANAEWQPAIRDELAARDNAGNPLSYDDLEQLPLTEMAFKEALRMTPPLAMIPRRTNRDCEFKGFKIPAHTMVRLRPLHTHYMDDIWPEPERYDPERFSEAASRGRHRFAFVPFGGGAHMCLGLNFAYMQAKCFASHFMRNFRVTLEGGYEPHWDMAAIPQPRDGLRITLFAV
jgi:cytochrome P450